MPDGAGSALRAHSCGTVPRTTWIRGLGKEANLQKERSARLKHLNSWGLKGTIRDALRYCELSRDVTSTPLSNRHIYNSTRVRAGAPTLTRTQLRLPGQEW